MSAFIVNDYHINAIITYGVRNDAYYWTGTERIKLNEETAPALATKLYRANVQSVNRRYNERNRSAGFQYQPVSISHLTAADIVRACDCLEYQSCERVEWERSQARKLLQAIRNEAVSVLTSNSQAWELRQPLQEAA